MKKDGYFSRLKMKKKKKIEEEAEDLYDYNEDSDILVTEKKTKQKKIRSLE